MSKNQEIPVRSFLNDQIYPNIHTQVAQMADGVRVTLSTWVRVQFEGVYYFVKVADQIRFSVRTDSAELMTAMERFGKEAYKVMHLYRIDGRLLDSNGINLVLRDRNQISEQTRLANELSGGRVTQIVEEPESSRAQKISKRLNRIRPEAHRTAQYYSGRRQATASGQQAYALGAYNTATSKPVPRKSKWSNSINSMK